MAAGTGLQPLDMKTEALCYGPKMKDSLSYPVLIHHRVDAFALGELVVFGQGRALFL